jgi:UrcA family protein
MEFPLILYMSPEGWKWQPKYLAHPCRPSTVTHHRTVIANLEVSNRRQEDSLQMKRSISTRIHEENHMYTKRAFMSSRAVLSAAVVASALFAGSVAAKDPVTVPYRVTTQGLDVSQPAGARELYLRLQHAAQVVCTHGMRVDLKPVTDERACYEKALGNAIGSVNLPLLTQLYLETHTLREAAARGIDVPVQMAAK